MIQASSQSSKGVRGNGGRRLVAIRVLALLVLAALVAPLAAAQQVAPPPVRLTAEVTEAAALPGGTASFEVLANNTGPIPLSFRFETTSNPPNWTVEFDPPNLTVPDGDSRKSTFIVYVPEDAAPGTVADLSFVGRNEIDQVTDVLTLTVRVDEPPAPTPTPAPRLSLSIAPASGEPGTEVESLLTILSHEAERLTVTLSISPNRAWNPHFKDGITVYPVDGGVPTQVRVRALVPDGTPEGHKENFVITAVAKGAAFQVPWNVTALASTAPPAPATDAEERDADATSTTPASGTGSTAPAPLARVEMRTSVEQVDVKPGETVNASLLLKNTGNVPLTLDLRYQPPAADWGVRLDAARVELPAGESRTVAVHVTAPEGIPPGGVADVLFQAIAGDLVQSAILHASIVPGEDRPRDETQGAVIVPNPAGGDGASVVPTAAWLALGVGTVGAAALFVANRPLREKLVWVGVGLYTRLAQPDILGHPERDRLYKLVEAQPGIHFHALQRDLGWNTGTLTYHLRVLERHQFIVSRRDGPYRRFFKVGAAPRKELFSADAPQGLRADVLEAIRNRHGISQSDLAMALGANKQTVNYHVKALERQGIIRVERRGRETFLHPNAAGVGPDAGEART